MEKEKKVIIVTGASRGIGRATAQMFFENGYAVYGLSRTVPEGDFSFQSILCDVTDYDALEKTFQNIYEKEGSIDCVINNAGWGIAGAVEFASDLAVSRILEINFCALEKSCRLSLKYLRESRGRIINVSSVAGIMPIAFQAYYSATKAAVLVYSRALAQEVKPYGVKVLAVLPGDTRTGFTAARLTETDNGIYSERVKRSVAKMEHDEQTGTDPQKVAEALYKAYLENNPQTSYVVGFPYKVIAVLNKILPQRLIDYILCRMYAK